jgi:HPt (histidine-containing phosphotransfer) domain-containing protein
VAATRRRETGAEATDTAMAVHAPATASSPWPGIDREQALMRVRGNEKILEKILVSFYENQKDTCEQVEAFLAAGNTQDAIMALHTLKGSAANIGASDLAKLATQAETSCRNGEREKLTLDISVLSVELRKVILGLAPLTRTPPADEGLSGSCLPAELARQAAELLKHIDEDVGEAQQTLERIRRDIAGSAWEGIFSYIGGCMARFDLDQAKHRLKQLISART